MNINSLYVIVKISQRNTFFFCQYMSMIINPDFPFCPIDYGCSNGSNNTTILTNKNICAIKNVLCYPILDSISSIVGNRAILSFALGNWFSFPVEDLAYLSQLPILHPLRAVLLYQFFQLAHSACGVWGGYWSSAMIWSMAVRRAFSRWTMAASSALRRVMSTCSRVSSCST